MVQVPYIVAVHRYTPGPGAAGNPQHIDTVHIFHSRKALQDFVNTKSHSGRWTHCYDGMPDFQGDVVAKVYLHDDVED